MSETGERFIVEMQKAKQNFFKDRSVFYATFPIQEQAKTSTWDFKLDAVYLVGILDFVFDKEDEQDNFIHYVSLKDQKGTTFYDKLHFVYIELPKFKKEPNELVSQQDKWLYVLRHLQSLKEMPDPLKEPVFEKLFHSAALANMNIEERKSYESSLKYYRDMQNVKETYLGEGEKKGVEKVARKLKDKGMDTAFIIEITGLSQEEVEAL